MKNDMRERILDTAIALFNEKGYGNVSLRDISGALGISVGNLNYHFKKKQDLLTAIMERNFLAVAGEEEIGSFRDLQGLWDRMLDSLLRYSFYFRDPSLAALNLLGPQNVESLQGLVSKAIVQLQEQGLFTAALTDAVREDLVRVIMFSHLGWVQQGAAGMDKAAFLRTHWLLLEPYLTPAGRELLQTEIS